MKSIAILVCTYSGDKPEYLSEMFSSIYQAAIPAEYKLRVYLHIDGELSNEADAIIKDFDIYKIIKSPNPIGLSKGLNKLIAEREDESYYFRMDADDICHPNRFVKQIEYMENHIEIDLLGGSISEFVGKPLNTVYTRRYPQTHELILKTIVKASPFAHVTVCFRDGFFDKFSDYPIRYNLCEDIAYWYQSLSQGAKAANLSDSLVYVRMDGAYGRRGLSKAIAEFKVYLKIVRWLKTGYQYPFIRLLFRFFPTSLVKLIYNSRIRTFFVTKK